ncbi:hypothetical protein UT300013_07050 [Paraclostridium sordellii]
MDNKSIVELKSELIEMIDNIEDKETLEEVFILSCIVKIIEINRDANFEFIKNKLRGIENIDVSDEKIIELYKSWKDLEKKYNS